MATVTAINMAVKMSVDEVEKGTKLARNEIAALNRMYAASKTDAQRLEEGLKLVERGLADGSVTAEKAASITKMLTDKYGEEAAAAKAAAEAEKLRQEEINKATAAANEQIKATQKRMAAINDANIGVANEKLKMLQGNFDKVTAAQERSNVATRNAKFSVLNEQIAAMQSNMGRMTGSLNDFGRGMEDAFVKSDEFAKSNWRVAGANKEAEATHRINSLGAMAVGAAFSAAAIAANQYVSSVGRIANEIDLAASLGDTRTNVKVLAQAISELSGVDVSQVTQGFQQLQTQIGLASVGQGKGQKILEMLGLDAASLSGMSATDQFNAVSDAIAKIEDRSTRAAIAQKLFGNAQIANAVASGQVKQTADDVAASVYKMTVAQEEATAKLDDMWSRTKNAIGSGWDRIVGEISEGIVAATGLGGAVATASESTAELTKTSEQLVRQMEEAEAAAKAEAEAIKKAKEEEERAQLEYYNTIESVEGKIRELTKGKDAQRAYELRQRGLTSEQTSEIMASEKRLAILEAEKKAKEQADKEAEDARKKSVETAEKIREKLESPAEKIDRVTQEMSRLVSANVLSMVDAEREINRVIKEQSDKEKDKEGNKLVTSMKLSNSSTFKQLSELQSKQQATEKRSLWVQEQQYKALQNIEANTRNQTGIALAR